MNDLRVAVIVPCFDDGATLLETLESLSGEEPHELVVVDDGSTHAATLAVLQELARSGTYVVTQENQGLAGARMTGVRATTAPYVQPLDADDRLERGALTRLADALDANPGAAAAWGDEAIFGSFEVVVTAADRVDPWTIWYLDEIPGTAMLRRSALEATGGWCFRDTYEDWDLWMTLAEHKLDGIRVPGVFLHYRRDPERMSAGGLTRHGELLEELRRRHPGLGAARRRNWLTSSAPLRMRLLFPLIEVLPGVSGRDKHRLRRFVAHPRRMLAQRRVRRAAARAAP